MSRIGKMPVVIPSGVNVTVIGGIVVAECSGKKNEYKLPDCITAVVQDNSVVVSKNEESKRAAALHGLSRTLIQNIITGVKDGFIKKLVMVGRGKKGKVEGKNLILEVGFSHPVNFGIPEGIQIKVEKTLIEVSGIDKQKVGEVAAELRSIQPPEPYKGSGIKYADEKIKKKAGKSAVGGGFTGSGK